MTTFLLGRKIFGYTNLGCGSGAGEGFSRAIRHAGPMTNTAITPPPRSRNPRGQLFPAPAAVLRGGAGSGGAGAFRGGDRLVREFEFLAPPEALPSSPSIGGCRPTGNGRQANPRDTGRQISIRSDGDESEIPASTVSEASSGDRLRIEKPSGRVVRSSDSAPASNENEKEARKTE